MLKHGSPESDERNVKAGPSHLETVSDLQSGFGFWWKETHKMVYNLTNPRMSKSICA